MYPVGCTSSGGYSTVTNVPCDGASGVGPNGQTYYLSGCVSNISGFSATTGLACNTVSTTSLQNGVVFIPGCFSTNGFSSITGQSCLVGGTTTTTTGGGTINPGLPITGAGSDAPISALLLLASGGLVAYGVTQLVRKTNA